MVFVVKWDDDGRTRVHQLWLKKIESPPADSQTEIDARSLVKQVSWVAKKAAVAFAEGDLELKFVATLVRPAKPPRLTPFFSLDRVSAAPTADRWAGRMSFGVSAALVGWMGFCVSALTQASANRPAVGCDLLDLTFLLLLVVVFSGRVHCRSYICSPPHPGGTRRGWRCIGGPDRPERVPDGVRIITSPTLF